LRKVELLAEQSGQPKDDLPEEEVQGNTALQTESADAARALAESKDQVGSGLLNQEAIEDETAPPPSSDVEEEVTGPAQPSSSTESPAVKESKDAAKEADKPEKPEKSEKSESRNHPEGSVSEATQVIESLSDAPKAPEVDSLVYRSGSSGSWSIEDLRDVSTSAEGVAGELCERLRMVLEPTLRGRLEGDYKTGKRIAMRKVLSWIASDYRKDRIWLRRTKPSKRTHRLLISLDNSSSMKSNGASKMSLAATLAIYDALSRLEISSVGVMSFGAGVRVLKSLDDSDQLSLDSLSTHFNFDEEASRSFSQGIPSALTAALRLFGNDEERKYNDMCLIVTDGRFDKEATRLHVQEMLARGHLPVLVIVDSKSEKSSSSVYDIKSVVKGSDGKMTTQPFLSALDFPFPYYAVIQSVPQLPMVLADLVKQWLELTAHN